MSVLPAWPAKAGGPGPVPGRLCLQGILFVLHTGFRWEHLPHELGYGSGTGVLAQFERWRAAGVFQRLHEIMLAELNAAGEIDWSRAIVDAGHLKATKGARMSAHHRWIAANQAPSIM